MKLTLITGWEGSGYCYWCGGMLPKYRRSYCCDEHRDLYHESYLWEFARPKRLRDDNYTCQHCGRSEDELYKSGYCLEGKHTYLEVHHIEPMDGGKREASKLNVQENLITLCHDCHLRAHEAMRSPSPPKWRKSWQRRKR